MRVAEAIETNLRDAFRPVRLAVHDDSHRHAGHAGARPGGESHFRVEIVSDVFVGKSRVERQRMVYAALADQIAGGVHALQLTTRTPAEDAA